jgi:hypothetical protein
MYLVPTEPQDPGELTWNIEQPSFQYWWFFCSEERRCSHVTERCFFDWRLELRAVIEPHASRTPSLPAGAPSRIDEQLGFALPHDINSPNMLRDAACWSAGPQVSAA